MPNDLSVWALVLDASPIVQAVVALLMVASIASWAIIFRKSREISQSRRGADQFDTQFWSGGDLAASVSEHRNQGSRGHRPAKHLRIGLRRVQPAAPAGHAGRSAARGRAPLDAGRADARNRPLGTQSRDARHGRLHQPLRRTIRHRVGNHERLSTTSETSSRRRSPRWRRASPKRWSRRRSACLRRFRP